MTKLRFIRNAVRWFALSIVRPTRTQRELAQYDFWFNQSQEAFQRAMHSTTQQEFTIARQQFNLASRRYWQHSKYICP